MSQQTMNGVVALFGGAVLAVGLFVPFAAVRYRRAGRLSGIDVVYLVLGLAYVLALWTYTLLPLPASDDVVCRDPILRPLAFLEDIRAEADGWSPVALLRNAAVLQVALNVALFVPLGVILRWWFGRGLAAATVTGFLVSLAIEVTQLTGVWGLYECAYRFFDVGDLLANTTGALGGWILARVARVGGRERQAPADHLGRGRRLVALVSDGLVFLVIGAAAAVTWRAWSLYVSDVDVDDIDLGIQAALQWGVPFGIEAAWLLVSGRTVGEWVVQVRAVDDAGRSSLPARLVKLLAGVGLLALLGAWDHPTAGLAFVAVAGAHLLAGLVLPRRGLTGLLTRTRLISTRAA